MFYAVNGLDTFQNIFDGVVHRIFAGFQGQSLMAHILECSNLACYFFLCKFFPCDILITSVIWAVHTAVYAVV